MRRHPLLRAIAAVLIAIVVNVLGIWFLAGLSAPARADEPQHTEAPEVVELPDPPRPPEPVPPPPQVARQVNTAPSPLSPPAPAPPMLSAPSLSIGVKAPTIDAPSAGFDVNAGSWALSADGAPGGGALARALEQELEQILDERSVERAPRPMRKIAPVYPRDAEDRGVTGFVQLRILIGKDGGVERIEVVSSSPRGVFDAAARDAVGQWRFSPGMHEGRPVRVWVKKRLEFTL